MKLKKPLKIVLPIVLLALSFLALTLRHEARQNPCLKKTKSMRRGMTRAQVVKIFEFEGCGSTIDYPSSPQQNGCTEVFVLRDCPCAKGKVYKINIDFEPAHKFSSWMDLKANYKMRGQDKIIKISKPVCEPLKTYNEKESYE